MADFVVKVGGEGGTDSPTTAGEFMALAAIREGNTIFTVRSFPAEIRGGLATYQTRLSDREVLSQGDRPDVLFCMNQEAFDNLVGDLAPGGVLVYDQDSVEFEPGATAHLTCYGVPMRGLAEGHVGEKRTKNMVLLGVFAQLFGMPVATFGQLVADKYGKRGEALVSVNRKALEVGAAYAAEHLTKTDPYVFEPRPVTGSRPMMVVDGSQAIGMGSLAAQVDFFAGYPITPATDIMQFLAEQLPRLGGQVIQVEDEIASLAACLGASYTGSKAMTATSGPGLSLMVELLGLATMTELPVVVVDVQRGGPSTGLPTKTENGDLNLAALGAHGDAPRVVVAPATIEDCFLDMVGAFNLAERFQTPVIVLSDQSMAMRAQAMAVPDLGAIQVAERALIQDETEGFRRYLLTEEGVSPMALPGTGTHAYHMITGLNHDELGYPSTNDGPLSVAMMDKRQHKIDRVRSEPGWSRVFGPEQGTLGLISWGTCEGAVTEAAQRLTDAGVPVRQLHLRLVWPLPVDEIRAFAETVDRVVVVELNYSGQLNQLIRAETLLPTESVRKCDGTPFTPAEVAAALRDLLPAVAAVPSSAQARPVVEASPVA